MNYRVAYTRLKTERDRQEKQRQTDIEIRTYRQTKRYRQADKEIQTDMQRERERKTKRQTDNERQSQRHTDKHIHNLVTFGGKRSK